jgi:hypothetical protein
VKITGTADDARIVGDENGFELHIETNVGDFVFNIHHFAQAFAENVDAQIGAWLREGEQARGTRPPRITEDDLDGYPVGHYKRIALEQEMNK